MMSSNRTQAIDTLTSATSARSAQDDVNDYFRHSAGYWKEIYERSGFEAALYRFALRLSVWHNQPLSTRRYMWKTDY